MGFVHLSSLRLKRKHGVPFNIPRSELGGDVPFAERYAGLAADTRLGQAGRDGAGRPGGGRESEGQDRPQPPNAGRLAAATHRRPLCRGTRASHAPPRRQAACLGRGRHSQGDVSRAHVALAQPRS